MPLHFASEPAEAGAQVISAVARIAARAEPPVELAAVLDADADFTLVSAHPVYDLRADALAGQGLEAAQETALRILIQTREATVAAAELGVVADATLRRPLNLNFGPYVAATAKAFRSLADGSALSQGDYEVRLLRCSALYLMAIWLHGREGADDVVIPLAPTPPGLVADRLYSVDEILAAIRPLASGLPTS